MLLVGIVSKGKDGARRLWKSFEWLEKKCAWRYWFVFLVGEVGGSRGRVETKTHAAGLCTVLSEAAAEWNP